MASGGDSNCAGSSVHCALGAVHCRLTSQRRCLPPVLIAVSPPWVQTGGQSSHASPTPAPPVLFSKLWHVTLKLWSRSALRCCCAVLALGSLPPCNGLAMSFCSSPCPRYCIPRLTSLVQFRNILCSSSLSKQGPTAFSADQCARVKKDMGSKAQNRRSERFRTTCEN